MILEPRETLSGLLGGDVVYTSFHPLLSNPFLRDFGEHYRRHIGSGAHLAIAGSVTVLCSERCLVPEGLQFMERAGIGCGTCVEAFANESDYLDLLRSHIGAGRRIAAAHTYDGVLIPKESLWVDPEVATHLNSKSSLAELVPREFTPRREIILLRELRTASSKYCHPFVVKAVTDLSTGSGGAVVIVRTPDDLDQAERRFGTCTELVLEEFVPFTYSLCLNFASDGRRVEYLGCGEQIVEEDGHYLGNWFGDEVVAPGEAIEVGETIMKEAMRLGYRGFAGFDIGFTQTGGPVVFDLNFRLCGSTVPLLFLPSIRRRGSTTRCARASWVFRPGPLTSLLTELHPAVEAGHTVPLLTYQDQGQSAMKVLLLGEDRDHVDQVERSIGAGHLPE